MKSRKIENQPLSIGECISMLGKCTAPFEVRDIVEHQQAEIEALKIENQALRGAANSYKIHYNKARTEAVKEFAERLKDYAEECKRNGYDGIGSHDIDDILKEMAGDTE